MEFTLRRRSAKLRLRSLEPLLGGVVEFIQGRQEQSTLGLLESHWFMRAMEKSDSSVAVRLEYSSKGFVARRVSGVE